MVINDEEFKEELLADLECNFGYDEGEALAWVEEHAEYVLNAMWDAYSHYLEEEAQYMEVD